MSFPGKFTYRYINVVMSPDSLVPRPLCVWFWGIVDHSKCVKDIIATLDLWLHNFYLHVAAAHDVNGCGAGPLNSGMGNTSSFCMHDEICSNCT